MGFLAIEMSLHHRVILEAFLEPLKIGNIFFDSDDYTNVGR